MDLKLFNTTKELKKDFDKNILNYDWNDLKKLYRIEYIDSYESFLYIIKYYLFKNRNIIKYVEKAKNSFNIERFERYLQWRINNKSNSNTVDFYKLVYGDNWEFYFKNKKITNFYDPNYVMLRDNCSYEQAIDSINRMKKNKVTSLEGFIKRHGEYKGRELFEKFKKTSNIFNKENIIKKYGEDRYDEIYYRNLKSRRENSPWCPEYWINKGYKGVDLKNKISEFQKFNSGVSIESIIKRFNGDVEYSNYIYSLINSKKDSSSFEHCLEITGDYINASILYVLKCSKKDHKSIKNFKNEFEYIEYNKKINKKMYNTLISNSLVIVKDDVDKFRNYCKKVNYYTKLNLRLSGIYKFGYDYKKEIGVNKKHIDHIYSKFDGFKNDVDPKIIGSIENLQLLYYKDNISKNRKSGIELESLYKKYNESVYTKIN